ncbi:hypothetical protein B566_EDAN002819 [Ephemera danica]|nr:hypothetical protein B566_EDAN002819 [Ephemera danica]
MCQQLSELRALGHTRDVALRGEQEVRNSEQQQILMSPRPGSPGANRETLLETDHTLMRDSQSTSTVLFNWIWGRR